MRIKKNENFLKHQTHCPESAGYIKLLRITIIAQIKITKSNFTHHSKKDHYFFCYIRLKK